MKQRVAGLMVPDKRSLRGQGTTETVLIIGVIVVGIAVLMLLFQEPIGALVGDMTAMVKGWVSGEAAAAPDGGSNVASNSGRHGPGNANSIESRGFKPPGWVWLIVIAVAVGGVTIGAKAMDA